MLVIKTNKVDAMSKKKKTTKRYLFTSTRVTNKQTTLNIGWNVEQLKLSYTVAESIK